MGQTAEQIEEHLKGSRENLRSNLEELGQKVQTAVDWRERFRSNPGAILAVAFGGGFILANVVGGYRTKREDPVPGSARTLTGTVQCDRKGQVRRAWSDIQSALVGVVAAKVTETLAELVPGFKEQLPAEDDGVRVVDGGAGVH